MLSTNLQGLTKRSDCSSLKQILETLTMANMFSVVISLLLLVEVAQALQCYNCSSNDYPGCGRPFNSDGIPTCQGPTCSSGYAQLPDGREFTLRQCRQVEVSYTCTGKIPFEGFDLTVCYCGTDLCNSADQSVNGSLKLAAHISSLILVAVSILLTHFAM